MVEPAIQKTLGQALESALEEKTLEGDLEWMTTRIQESSLGIYYP